MRTPPPSRPQPRSDRGHLDHVVEAWSRAEHDADDLEIQRLVADGVVLVVVGQDLADLRGRRAVIAWHRDQAANALHERDVPVRRVYGWASVLDDAVRHSRVTGSLFGFRGGGRRVSYRLRRLFELEEGRVSRLTVWPDLEALERQLATD
ncbi:MAG TPA: nuclear transport factor 2 family protein [Candidatus Eisenbacteria bacterium]|nr:nuclear transport factor 2 family protein [Candidatus Eisenbacteria bacterium]